MTDNDTNETEDKLMMLGDDFKLEPGYTYSARIKFQDDTGSHSGDGQGYIVEHEELRQVFKLML